MLILKRQELFSNFCDNIYTVWWIVFLFPGFGGGVISIGIAFCVYTLLLLVSSSLVWLSSCIFSHLPITVIILILFVLATFWLLMSDDWILCWYKLFYQCLLGKDCISKLKVTSRKFTTLLLHWVVSSRSCSLNNLQKYFFNFFWGWFTDILENC